MKQVPTSSSILTIITPVTSVTTENSKSVTKYHKVNIFLYCNQQLDICRKIDSESAKEIVKND